MLVVFYFWGCKSSTADYSPLCDYSLTRVNGYEYIKPLLAAEPACESRNLLPLKTHLAGIIDSLKKGGSLHQASVYFKEFEHGEWISLNDEERYHPASLMKVSLLLSVLQMVEANPALLRETIVYEKPPTAEINPQYYSFPTIQPGQSYTVHELLYHMIANSDNHATWLLASRIDPARTPKMFTDLHLPAPVPDELKFTLSAREYAVFFKAIYNAALIGPEYADYAARLLSNCAFQEGFKKGFPANTRMWHKFGEWRFAGQDHELHEAGFVYLRERPCLVVIMTRGTDTEKLAAAIRRLSSALGANDFRPVM